MLFSRGPLRRKDLKYNATKSQQEELIRIVGENHILNRQKRSSSVKESEKFRKGWQHAATVLNNFGPSVKTARQWIKVGQVWDTNSINQKVSKFSI